MRTNIASSKLDSSLHEVERKLVRKRVTDLIVAQSLRLEFHLTKTEKKNYASLLSGKCLCFLSARLICRCVLHLAIHVCGNRLN